MHTYLAGFCGALVALTFSTFAAAADFDGKWAGDVNGVPKGKGGCSQNGTIEVTIRDGKARGHVQLARGRPAVDWEIGSGGSVNADKMTGQFTAAAFTGSWGNGDCRYAVIMKKQ